MTGIRRALCWLMAMLIILSMALPALALEIPEPTLSPDAAPYDAEHPEGLQDCIDRLPYNTVKLAPFVKLLEGLDFTRCLLGHADAVLSRAELLTELKRHLPEE